ncbi:MAG: twin-arginine translocase TatA/TatE family subunit [Nitrospinota bacterium]|jgi:sec-independent protein translocase protein TatA|nr:twin-arginine translocase TatA/TatE family subunit [Nitrospinota bacterium]MDP7581155.1 twin-arginine translocase TatA/TatE family subunit [Nitrospinota bacterium]HJN02521.1 twin-arginine translocase TatA/TatE family subunit [Nitrospinota bacterium]|tara:strand:+ start:415 stop:645 length:231 start_codon:yes stop_codon:yes gene_type:complete
MIWPGMGELFIILIMVLIIFGAGKLPQIGDALGKGIKNFKKATKEIQEEVDEVKDEVKPSLEDKKEEPATAAEDKK